MLLLRHRDLEWLMAQRKTKRNPTNAEIMLKLEELGERVNKNSSALITLNQWKRDQEIARTAVAEYVKENPKPTSPTSSDQWLNRELVKTLGVALAVILALAELLIQLRGGGIH